MKFSTYIYVSVLLINGVWSNVVKRDVNWNGNNWSLGCDFPGNDLTNAQIRGEDCGTRCAQTQGCSHFSWSSWNGGTCWMKQGPISKSQATETDDKSTICGICESVPIQTTGLGPMLSGVLATCHEADEPGACALPPSNYAVTNPVALGSMDSLNHLKFKPELCGQVLEVNCGNGPLNIIITNSNYGRGLDLYASTWNKLTNNQPAGETSCTVQLTSQNAFNSDGPRCFYKPGTDFDNAYYSNIGLLNTKGQLVIKATIDNQPGEHRGDNPYYAFNFGPIDKNKQVIFTLDNGNTHEVFLRDCQYEQNEQRWS